MFFFHDSDHDPRETVTILHERHTDEERRLNFTFANQLQKFFSPLFAKRVLAESKRKLAAQLAQCVEAKLVEHFSAIEAANVADFCLEMYRRMELIHGIRVVRSGDPAFREQACEIDDYFIDVQHEGELVRARKGDDCLFLHKGGDNYIRLPNESYTKGQISPTRDTRLRWMQSVVQCTHYIAGAGELQYLNKDEAPGVEFVTRDYISEPDRAYVPEVRLPA